MNRHQVIAALAASCLAGAAFAQNGAAAGAQITGIAIDAQIGNMAFIGIRPNTKGNNPACSTNAGSSFVLPLNTPLQLQMFAMLVSARANSQPISLAGSGLCDTYSDVETLVFVSY